MSSLGPRKPIIIPIPVRHLNAIDTLVTSQPTTMRLGLTNEGYSFFRKTIFPYIWQGYQVKLRSCPMKELPTGSSDATNTKIFQTITLDFFIKANDGVSGGAFGLYFSYPAINTQTNALMKWVTGNNDTATTLYTENGIDYSYYSYVIYP